MVLVDTSVWIEHFRRGLPSLSQLLNIGEILIHPFVTGELACGNLKARANILSYLNQLPCVSTAEDEEVLSFIAVHKLYGAGLGLIDIHLLTSSKLSGVSLWTMDKSLAKIAERLSVKYSG